MKACKNCGAPMAGYADTCGGYACRGSMEQEPEPFHDPAIMAMALDHAADLLWCLNKLRHSEVKRAKKLFDDLYEESRRK